MVDRRGLAGGRAALEQTVYVRLGLGHVEPPLQYLLQGEEEPWRAPASQAQASGPPSPSPFHVKHPAPSGRPWICRNRARMAMVLPMGHPSSLFVKSRHWGSKIHYILFGA